MKNLFILLLFALYAFSINAQQSVKYTTDSKGRIGMGTGSVTWTITNRIVNNTDTSLFFFLPASRLNDVSVARTGKDNGIYGMCITSKDDLIKFADALIYLGKQKGKKSEALYINQNNNIVLSILSTLPNTVCLSGYSTTIPKRNAVKLGKTILKNIVHF